MNKEEDLFAVMDEMSCRQGYNNNNNNNNKNNKQKSGLEKEKQLKSSSKSSNKAEQNRPSHDHNQPTTTYSLCPEKGWEGAIWNPLITDSKQQLKQKHQEPSSNINFVSPEVEIQRRRSYEKFKKQILAIFMETRPSTENQQQLQMWKSLPYQNIMEHWHFCIKLEESTCYSDKNERIMIDPILISPSIINNNDKALHLLESEIAFQWERKCRQQPSNLTLPDSKASSNSLPPFLSRYVKTQLMSRIQSIVVDIYKDFYNKLNRLKLNSTSHKTKFPKIKFNVSTSKHDENDSNQVSVTYNGLSLFVNQAHYQKLKTMFQRRNTSKIHNNHGNDKRVFAQALFSLLCRYDTLAGAGLQSSLTGDVFDVLLQQFSCRVECFASPLNCRYSQFCSAFPDVDTPFGSIGSFFDVSFSDIKYGGCFQANPPFVPYFIHQMVEKMEYHLQICNQSQIPLMFIIFVPKWEHTEGHEKLTKSKYCMKHVSLSQKEDTHYYCEGTQHRRRKRYRIASFDTSIFFLMNDEAKVKWQITEDFVNKLKSAFQKVPDESGNTQNESSRPTISTQIKSKSDILDRRKNEKRKNEPSLQKLASNRSGKKKKKLISEKMETSSQLNILSNLGITQSNKNPSRNRIGKKGKHS